VFLLLTLSDIDLFLIVSIVLILKFILYLTFYIACLHRDTCWRPKVLVFYCLSIFYIFIN